MAKVVGILNIGCFGAVVLITLLAIHGSVRLLVVGFVCAALTVGMYASPMAAMVSDFIFLLMYKTFSQITSWKFSPYRWVSRYIFMNECRVWWYEQRVSSTCLSHYHSSSSSTAACGASTPHFSETISSV